MIDIISAITVNVLTALYQPFLFAVLTAYLFMYWYLFIVDNSRDPKNLKDSVLIWLRYFKASSKFRRLFFLAFYFTLILFKTLLNRNMWMNPLSNVIGQWSLYIIDNATGESRLTTECVENTMLFIPFCMLLLWWRDIKCDIIRTIYVGIKYVFLFSLSIEFTQLFFRLGTFQLSDLFYNTLGGLIGALLYWLFYRLN
ncbi:TPA: VanZ family protein, partial [Enterococcus faecium]|nr:VanZ family protein [Enterococcus faecium]